MSSRIEQSTFSLNSTSGERVDLKRNETDNSQRLYAGLHVDRFDYASGSTTSTLSLRSLLEACFRHPGRLLMIAGITLCITLASILLLPKRYQASMQLVVLNTRHYSVVSSDADQPDKQVTDVTDSDVNSQAELLHSHDVLSDALDSLTPSTSLTPNKRDKSIEEMSRNLDVAPVRQSSILNVTYADSSPEKARGTLQAVADSFVAKEVTLLRPASSHRVFDGLLKQARSDLAEAQQQFATFKVTHGIASLSQDEAGLVQQLRQSTAKSDALSSELTEEQHRLSTTESQIHSHPERIVTQNRSVPNQQAVEALTAKLVELENKRTSLLTGFLPSDRFVQEVDGQITTTRDALKQLQTVAASETTTDINPLHQELASQLAKSSITSAALQAERQSVEAQKQDYFRKLNSLEQTAAGYEVLEHRVAEAQQNYDTAVHKRDQATVEDALDRDRILNVAFVAKPSASSVPVQPRPHLYLALGIFAALFLSVASCAMAELGRETVYSPAELDAFTGVMTLVVMPLEKLPAGGPFRSEDDFSVASEPRSSERTETSGALQPHLARSVQS